MKLISVLCVFELAGAALAGRYFVQLKNAGAMDTLFKQDDSIKAANHLRDAIKSRISFGNFGGFAGELTDDMVQRLKSNPLIAKVTPDIAVTAMAIEEQSPAPNHLVRLSRDFPVIKGEEDRRYCYDNDFEGENVNAYVIDTGVNTEHPDFEGRAENGPNFSGAKGCEDKVGHGTHVAGIIGSKHFGVAKKINIVSVKVLDDEGAGTLSSVISGLEFAVNHRISSGRPGVVNLSLGAYKNAVLDEAVMATYQSGMVVVVAAGNNNMDACGTSPAGSPFAIAVGAIDDATDRIAPFSNYGACVNVFASGVAVESLCGRNERSPTNLSGTSMASPVVAGLAGILLDQGVYYDDVPDKIEELSEKGAIPKSSILQRYRTPNRIANNGIRCY